MCGGTNNTEFQNALPHPLSHHGYRARNNTPGLPCAILAMYIQNSSIDNFRLRWKQPSAVWREGIQLNNADDIDLNNLRLRQPHDNDNAAIGCAEVTNITLRNSRSAVGTSTFIHINHSDKSTFIRYGGNDFSQAKTALSQSGQNVELIPFKDLQ